MTDDELEEVREALKTAQHAEEKYREALACKDVATAGRWSDIGWAAREKFEGDDDAQTTIGKLIALVDAEKARALAAEGLLEEARDYVAHDAFDQDEDAALLARIDAHLRERK